ncbi:MAG: hypothetical protein FP813_08455 [Desulfurivibrio sp.]|nr:hypothetical protein [Desulfurivibrio sp.]MBU3937090.1 hypothetical protein [Pseudomonadota bacterium]MBU4034550.1 hypothetical protein [Pseudomonadota bacterium]
MIPQFSARKIPGAFFSPGIFSRMLIASITPIGSAIVIDGTTTDPVLTEGRENKKLDKQRIWIRIGETQKEKKRGFFDFFVGVF